MAITEAQLLQALERRGIAYSFDLQNDLDTSQATVSRLLKAAGGRIYRLGKGQFHIFHLFFIYFKAL